MKHCHSKCGFEKKNAKVGQTKKNQQENCENPNALKTVSI